MANDGIAKTFAYHKPSSDAIEKIEKIRKAYSDLNAVILETAPHSRERSVAITELETSAMWAVKSIVHNDPESEVQS